MCFKKRYLRTTNMVYSRGSHDPTVYERIWNRSQIHLGDMASVQVVTCGLTSR